MNPTDGASVLVRILVECGVRTVYTVPSEQLAAVAVAAERCPDLRVVQARDEQGASFMAYGHSRSSGEVAALLVTSGPGFLNSTTALATARANGTPLVCLTGYVTDPEHMQDWGGPLHALPGQTKIGATLCRLVVTVETAEELLPKVTDAVLTARSASPGPVLIEISEAAQIEKVRLGTTPLPRPHQCQLIPPLPISADIEHAATLLASARRPLIYLGGGAVAAAAEVTELAELLGAPAISHIAGRGVVPADNPLAFGATVGHRLWADADAVLVVGSRLYQQRRRWGLGDPRRIVQVDSRPEAAAPGLGKQFLAGDARMVMKELLDAVRERSRPGAYWDSLLHRASTEAASEINRLRPQVDFVRAIRRALPRDGILVEDLTQVAYVARICFPVFAPRTFIPATSHGALGLSIPCAIGASIANPGAPVVALCGDGGFFYNEQELLTAAAEHSQVAVVVFNDSAFGNVRRTMSERFGLHEACGLANPDLVKVAAAFGLPGARVDNPADLEAALATALAAGCPSLVEVVIGPMPSPWPLLRLGAAVSPRRERD